MTREEAKEIMSKVTFYWELGEQTLTQNQINEALDMAIKALEAEDVLGKIKAKLIEEKECAYADFERYKVEYLGQDWSDVYDSLPQDDFRYGMERCIDIINKYMAESEDKA